jgi:hypothetical protein
MDVGILYAHVDDRPLPPHQARLKHLLGRRREALHGPGIDRAEQLHVPGVPVRFGRHCHLVLSVRLGEIRGEEHLHLGQLEQTVPPEGLSLQGGPESGLEASSICTKSHVGNTPYPRSKTRGTIRVSKFEETVLLGSLDLQQKCGFGFHYDGESNLFRKLSQQWYFGLRQCEAKPFAFPPEFEHLP